MPKENLEAEMKKGEKEYRNVYVGNYAGIFPYYMSVFIKGDDIRVSNEDEYNKLSYKIPLKEIKETILS